MAEMLYDEYISPSKQVINKGEKKQYYWAEGKHPAIISDKEYFLLQLKDC